MDLLFSKKMIFFHEIFQVGACPNFERFLNIRYFFYSYVQDIQSSVSSTFLRYLRLLNALEGTFFLEKDDFFMKYFKLVHAQI